MPEKAMTEKVLLVVHQEHSDPGRVACQLRELGFGTDIRRLACGDRLPASMEEHAGVVIFGGPMSANDDMIPFIREELDWIPMAVASGRPYLGICLGAQLLARALGARVGPHPEGLHEIGYYPVRPTAAGRELFGEGFHAYQWHGEGFDLPSGAVRLAESAYFENQAIRVGERAYGLQFHPEVTETIMRRWTTKAAHRMVLPGAQCRERHFRGHAAHDGAIDTWLRRFLSAWLGRERPALAAE
ncbi:MAG: glutamine amidotransferase [Alphaproteobacteria bacterium]|nr:glutamine amidotransferase [Alphaproteobacteria bacterium]